MEEGKGEEREQEEEEESNHSSFCSDGMHERNLQEKSSFLMTYL